MAAPTDPRIKAQALAELVAGAPLKSTARKFGLSHQTLRQWRDAAGLDPVLTEVDRADVSAALDRYICVVLEVLGEQVKRTLASDWLKEHGIDGYIQLHRAFQEGVARVVEAQHVAPLDEQEPIPLRRTG